MGGAAVELLETMRWSPDVGFARLDRHLGRLAASADALGLPCSLAGVNRALDRAVAGAVGALRARLVLSGGTSTVTVGPAPSPPDGPLVLAVDTVPVAADDPSLRHKTTHRDVYRDRSARHPGADDVLLVNDRGEVTEATVANVVLHLDGRWVTPPVDSGCLPGVARAALLDSGALVEDPVTVADLSRATGLALVSSLRGWRAARLA